MKHLVPALVLPGLLQVISLPARAQNTGGVSGPGVEAGTGAVGARIAFDPDSGDAAQRLFVETALSGALKLRGTLQTRTPGDGGMDFDHFRAELTWQVTPDDRRWQSGLRLDARLRNGKAPEEVAVRWLNEVRLSPATRLRLNAVASRDIGRGASGDIGLSTQADLEHALPDGPKLGLSLFSEYGPAGDIAPWHAQEHQLGPAIRFKLHDRLSVEAGALFGLTGASADTEFRLFLKRAF